MKFLHDMFEDESWWFESFRILRKVMFTLVARVMINQGEQLVCACVILVISQTVVSQYKPYLERTANRIELLAQTVLIVCMIVSSMYFTGEPAEDQARHSAAGAVFALLFCTLILYLVAIV